MVWSSSLVSSWEDRTITKHKVMCIPQINIVMLMRWILLEPIFDVYHWYVEVILSNCSPLSRMHLVLKTNFSAYRKTYPKWIIKYFSNIKTKQCLFAVLFYVVLNNFNNFTKVFNLTFYYYIILMFSEYYYKIQNHIVYW